MFTWKREIAPKLGTGSVVPVGDGFQRFVAAPAVSSEIAKTLSHRLQEEKTEPYDTHPPLRDRIAAARNVSETFGPQNTEPASSLLDNLSATEVKFVETCLSDITPGSLKHVAWDDVASQVTIPSWQKFVNEYFEPLLGVTAAAVPDHVAKFPAIGSRIRDPKGMLLSPPQRTARAGGLFASALALAMIRSGWQVQIEPAVFRMWRGDQEFNPFDAIEKLLAGKLSRQDWQARCRELQISELVLLGDPKAAAEGAVPLQAELFSVELPKG